ncbi:LacI family DNA-binding transcriptional regulator [Roseateles toxinivorans]|uniref:LacI family transcriptional regulator n=1 Tax=Roseateles toxinivorans TaxID=270368 RepID=A0A4R6QKA0_9BURK|nr:LacI family DNA-binding transcriptional regulator [Roseateles toxinivorans]TDP63727.1 LacI family transcriptional regulator [Roseateles toxinivorans]
MPRRSAETPDATPGAAASRSTIADVARVAGVSKATVSRFLNRRDELLTRDIAARVEAAIAELGYSPSPMAQALKRGRTRLIGLVVADVTNPFSVAVLRGAEQACQEAGYLVMLFNLGNQAARELEAIEALSSYQVEGFILNTLGSDPAALAAATRLGKPVVLVDRRHAGMQSDFVSLDNAGAVLLAAGHLAEQGHGELLFISEPTAGVSSRQERAQAFQAFLATHDGHSGHSGQLQGSLFECDEQHPQALDAALLAARQRAGSRRLGVLASNAVVTLRVAAALARLGWHFGEELGFVGFDETEWAPHVGPGLSAIAQPTGDLGRIAARCLLERLQGHQLPPRQTLLPGRLIVRGSSRKV